MVEELKNLIQQIIKAKKNRRLYPTDNPIYIKTIDDVFSRLTSLLEPNESLEFHITQYDIFSHDEVIYHNEDKYDSLALLLFKDGLQKLTVKRGIPRSELEEFIKIISLNFEEEVFDDDIVTLMWEKDFHYIETVVDESFLVDDDTYEETAIAQARESANNTGMIMKAYEEAFEAEKSKETHIVPLMKDDLESLIQEIESETKDKTLILLHLLFEILSLEETDKTHEDTAGLINEVLTYAVTQGNMEAIVLALEKIAEGNEKYSYSDKADQSLESIRDHVNSRDVIMRFGILLDNGMKLSEKIIHKFSTQLDRSSIPHFIDVLGELETASSRRIVIKILSELGKRDLDLVLKGLADDRWYLVRNTIHILRRIGDRSAVTYIRPAVNHPDPRVRKEAILALGELGQGDSLHVLKDLISDQDESIRIAAIRAVGLMGIPSAKEVILEKIKCNAFKDKSFTEKKECFHALARWKDRDIIDILMKIVKKRTFFNSTKNNEIKAGAAYCLGLIGAKEACTILGKLKHSNNRLLRDNALKAIKKLNYAKAG
ncbi:MAG: HEAT repeat domain-containing protein [Thermodesulfobacteriota bacterium]|nr:HEAT repeat domain-containing protein [Thermodesulfobacteriota bacterium]